MTDSRNAFSLDAYLADLAPLINLDCGTRTPAGVARVADIMTAKYEAIGWQVTRHQFAAECGPCLEATNAPGAAHYDVMLVGHMDTVFPEGTAAKRPLKIEGNQAFGPGVSDMKSGLLSTWYALKEMDPAVLAKLKVLVCCNCDEEIGSPWSKEWLVEKAKQSGCVLVAEAARPNGDLISARKGNAKYRITFHGSRLGPHRRGLSHHGAGPLGTGHQRAGQPRHRHHHERGGGAGGDRRQRGTGLCRGDRRLAFLEQ